MLWASTVFWLLAGSSDLMPSSWELFPEMIGLFAVGLSEVGLGLSNSQKRNGCYQDYVYVVYQ